MSLSGTSLSSPSLEDDCRLALTPPFGIQKAGERPRKRQEEKRTRKKAKICRQMCERRCSFLSVFWSGRVKDGELRSQPPRDPPATSQRMQEIKRSCDVEDPQMPHLLPVAWKEKGGCVGACWRAAFCVPWRRSSAQECPIRLSFQPFSFAKCTPGTARSDKVETWSRFVSLCVMRNAEVRPRAESSTRALNVTHVLYFLGIPGEVRGKWATQLWQTGAEALMREFWLWSSYAASDQQPFLQPLQRTNLLFSSELRDHVVQAQNKPLDIHFETTKWQWQGTKYFKFVNFGFPQDNKSLNIFGKQKVKSG